MRAVGAVRERADQADRQLAGYVMLRDLGAGATGTVRLAREESSGDLVAVKFLSPPLADDPGFVAHFRQEAETLRRIRHPNVVSLRRFQETPPALVLDLVQGVPLRSLLAQGPTTPEGALLVLRGSLHGLHAAHLAGIVHRDYKPENVLVDEEATSRLVDFGVAVPQTTAGELAGTPAYMAPEQWVGGPATTATDVYAATLVLYECLTGAAPFDDVGDQTLELAHRTLPVPLDVVPVPLRRLVATGAAKATDERYPDAATFLAALEEAAERAYGPDWASRGRKALAGSVAALAGLFPISAAGGAGLAGTVGSSAAGIVSGKVVLAIGGAALAIGITAGVFLGVRGGGFSADHLALQRELGRPPASAAPAPAPAAASTPPTAVASSVPPAQAPVVLSQAALPASSPAPATIAAAPTVETTVPGPLDRIVTVEPAPSVVSLAASTSHAAVGDPVTLDALVRPAKSVGPAPTGAVQFSNQSGPLGPPRPLDTAGRARATIADLPAGSHRVVARYLGDATLDSSTSAPVLVSIERVVTQLQATAAIGSGAPPVVRMAAVLTGTEGRAVAGRVVNFEVTGGGGCSATTGDDGTAACELPLIGNGLNGLVGFTATFDGDATHAPSSSSGGAVGAS